MTRQFKTLRIILLLSALIAWSPVGWAQGGGPSPLALIEAPVFEAGKVIRGDDIKHTFVVRNQGDAVLKIEEVSPACGCTVADYDEEIAPGGQGFIHTVVRTTSFKGPIAKQVTVFTNDMSNPRLLLTLKADIESSVEVQRGYARHQIIRGQQGKTLTQTVWSATLAELEVEGVDSPQPWIKTGFRPANEVERMAHSAEGNLWIVETSIAANAPSGPINEKIIIRTNHPRSPEVALPVSGMIRDAVVVSPKVVDFGSFEPLDPRRHSFLIINYGNEPITVDNVSASLDGLLTEVRTVEKGKRFQVNLTLDPQDLKGPFTGSITVSTSHPELSTLTAAVKGKAL